MIAVIAPMSRQIEGDREPLLTAGKIAFIECVRFLGGGKAGILADRPRPVSEHGGAHTPGKGSKTGQIGLELHMLKVCRRIQSFDVYAFMRFPNQRVRIAAFQLLCCKRAPFVVGLFVKIRHRRIRSPFRNCKNYAA